MGRISFLLLAMFVSCQSKPNQTEKQLPEIPETKQESTNQVSANDTINGAIGVVVVNDNITDRDTIRLFDKTGSLWYKFSFFYDEDNGRFNHPNEEFSPLSFHPDYFLLVLSVTNKLSDRYEVMVNEKTGKRKYLIIDAFLTFQTWEEHILDAFSVGFDVKTNSLRKDPLDGSDTLHFDRNEFYHPTQIKGEWLQVKWGSEGNWSYGWVKWEENGRLIIELNYFA